METLVKPVDFYESILECMFKRLSSKGPILKQPYIPFNKRGFSMKRHSVRTLLAAGVFTLLLAACAGSPDTANSADGKDTPAVSSLAQEEDSPAFALSGAVGWTGAESISWTESTLNNKPAWTITNTNWNAGGVFTVDLGDKRLGQFMGFECKVKAEAGDLVWKKFTLDVAKDDDTLGPILNAEPYNKTIGVSNTEKAGEVGKTATISIPFTALDANTATLSGAVEFAIGISAPGGTVYTIFDMKLIPLAPGAVSWLEAPPLKDALLPWFEYFGMSTIAPELKNSLIMQGLVRHGNSTTIGNEWKPDYILGKEPANIARFKARDGKTYDVPASLFFDVVDQTLALCRDNGLELRGHTLVWHSQTPKWFFRSAFKNNGELVDAATMSARQEWYIKTVLEHVTAWEEANNDGKRIVKHWDVVNEAVSDGANDMYWLRSNGDWYAIYKNDSYIVNAFVLANKYAPKDVRLVYNDYNSYQSAKTKGILKVVEAIKANPQARIDAVGMQSHVKIDYPGVPAFKAAVEAFLATGLDVQITELDIHNVMRTEAAKQRLADLYHDYFKMFIDLRKTPDRNGIQGVTIWGISDAGTWLTSHHKITSYPLLFDAWYNTKKAFDAVIEAGTNYKAEN